MTTTFSPVRRVAVALMALALGALSLVSLSSPAKASVTTVSNWLQVSSPTSGPSPRYDAAMAYDAATGTTVLFGGFNGSQLAETWTWNGIVWTKQSPLTSPPALQGAAMAYDAATHNVVLFGGLGANGPQSDTWTWDGATWTKQFVSGPVARSDATMVYDNATNNVVLFGGKGANGPLSDTWSWTGTQWIASAQTGPVPTPRYEQSMAYDVSTSDVVLYGGLSASGPLSDTWTWDGTTWTQQPAASPPARYGASMVYDATNNELVLFGGSNGTSIYAETWVWNGVSWSILPSVTAPPQRYLAAMAYDTAANNAVLFGGDNATSGLSDTWSFLVVPSAPLNVRANSNVNSQSVVTWSVPTSNGGGALFGYNVTATDLTASSRGGQTCSTMGTTTVTVTPISAGITTCTVTGLTNGDQYNFAVTAVNSVGTGPSATSNVVRPATVPQAPTISKVVVGAGVASVFWSVPAVDGGTPVGSYRVTASPGGAFCHVPRSMTSCRIGGLQNGVAYTFTMTATNAAGTSPISVPASAVQPMALPGAPTIITKSVTGANITIVWRAPAFNGGVGLVGYDVYVGSSPNGAASRPVVPLSPNQLSYTFRGTPGYASYVIVRAVDAAGIGPFSNQVAAVAGSSAAHPALPGAPIIFTKIVAGANITIYWRPPVSNGGTRLVGYDVYVGSSPNGAASRSLVSVPFNQFSYTFRGTPGHASYVIVRAVNPSGIGPFSNQVAAVAR
jgi:hypothetical protein